MHPAEASHGDLGMVTSDDVIIAISNSGETAELSGLIPFLKRFNVGLIAMTGSRNSTLAKSADVHLDVSVKEEACPLGVVPTASTTAALAMGRCDCRSPSCEEGLKQEDFAFFHPGGNLREKTIHQKSKTSCTQETPFLCISENRNDKGQLLKSHQNGSELRLSVMPAKKILGVLTDGDIRRGIEKWGKEFFDMKAGEVMTKIQRQYPKTNSQ